MDGIEPRKIREGIIELLTLLSDADAQTQYERNVPVADVPAELVCMWFDDSYHPTDAMFKAAFTREQLQAMEDFHRFYDTRVDGLSSDGTVASLLDNPAWRDIMEAASSVLSKVKGDNQ